MILIILFSRKDADDFCEGLNQFIKDPTYACFTQRDGDFNIEVKHPSDAAGAYAAGFIQGRLGPPPEHYSTETSE